LNLGFSDLLGSEEARVSDLERSCEEEDLGPKGNALFVGIRFR
jgi:hypothetical protein